MAYRHPIDSAKFAAFRKEAALMKESLDLLLAGFDRIKEWSDVDKWLRKLLRLLDETGTPFIPNKPVLFQRLAQCLSPALPAGIHNTVLKIYDRILQNCQKSPENLLNDLFYFTQGLFPFYRLCSNQFKPAVVDLLQRHFLPLGADLGPLVPALLEALAPPLAENNEAVQKLTFAFLDRLAEPFPPPFLFATVWMVAFRSPKCRYGCLKFLFYVLNRSEQQNADPEEEEEVLRLSKGESTEECSPGPPQSLELGLDDDEAEGDVEVEAPEPLPPSAAELATQNSLEADPGLSCDNGLELELEPGSSALEAGCTLSEAVLRDSSRQSAAGSRPATSPRTASDARLGKENVAEGDDEAELKADPKVGALGDCTPPAADVRPAADSQAAIKRSALPSEPVSAELPLLPEGSGGEAEYALFVAQAAKRRRKWAAHVEAHCAHALFPNKTLFVNAVRRCLADPNILIKKKTLDFLLLYARPDHEAFSAAESAALARCVAAELEKPDMLVKKRAVRYLFGTTDEDDELEERAFAPPERNLAAVLAAFAEMLAAENCAQFPAVFKMLQTLFMEEEAAIELFVGRLSLPLVDALAAVSAQAVGGEEGGGRALARRFLDSTFSYVETLVRNYIAHPAEQLSFGALELLWAACAADAEEKLAARQLVFEGLLKLAVAIDPAAPAAGRLFGRLTRILTDCAGLQLGALHAVGLDFIGKFERLLDAEAAAVDVAAFEQSLAFSALVLRRAGQRAHLSAWLGRLGDLLERGSRAPLFTQIAVRGFLGFAGDAADAPLAERALCLAVQRSWQLLDDVEFHAAGFALILELHAAQPAHTFAAVRAGLRAEEVRVRQTCLQRMVIFWKLSSCAELRGASRGLEDFAACELLERLEDAHPVLRQIAKSWLIDAAELYPRVADALLKGLLAECCLFATLGGRLVHTREYDARRVLWLFGLLRGFVANDPRKFAQFVLRTALSDHLVAECFLQIGEELAAHRLYHQLLLATLFRFLQGLALPFMGARLVQDNLLVNTAACELLETHARAMLGEDARYLSAPLLERVLRCYHLFVATGSAVMQVHVLGLLKFALFHGGGAAEPALLERVFVERRLLATVLGGIRPNENNYTLLKVIDFLQAAIAAFAEGAPEPRLRAVVGEIFAVYTALIPAPREGAVAAGDSAALLISAVSKLVSRFCGLDALALAARPQPRTSFISIFAFGGRGAAKGASAGFKHIERFFLDSMPAVLRAAVAGWRCCVHPEAAYALHNIGGGGLQAAAPPPAARADGGGEYVERLFAKYRREFFDALLALFIESFAGAPTALARNPTAQRLLDMLLFLEVEPRELGELIQHSASFRQAAAARRRAGAVSWAQSQADIGCLALFTLATRFRAQPFIEDIARRKAHLRERWFAVMDFARLFGEGGHVLQLCWVVNLYLVAAAQFPLPEIIDEYRVKSALHIHENDVLERIVGFVCDDAAQGGALEPNPAAGAFTFAFPLPAELAALCVAEPGLYCPKLFARFEEEPHLRYFLKVTALKFLKAVTTPLFKSTYGANKLHRVARRVHHLLQKMFAYMEGLLQRRTELAVLLYEEVLEYVFDFVAGSRQFLMADLAPLVARSFDSDLFFECSARGLGLWARIVDWHAEHSQGAVLEAYLANANFSSLFRSKREETRVRFKSFHRLCFILYAGRERPLGKRQLKFLLEAIRDALKDPALSAAILVVLFFCLRIVAFNAPPDASAEIFGVVWPTVFALLVQIAQDQLLPGDPAVKLASLKLLEAFCADEIGDVFLHFFALGFDHCCVAIAPAQPGGAAGFAPLFPFVPLLTRMVQGAHAVAQPFVQNELPPAAQRSAAPVRAVFRGNAVESAAGLSDAVLAFMRQFAERNCLEHVVDLRDFENLIIEDFIALNSFTTHA